MPAKRQPTAEPHPSYNPLNLFHTTHGPLCPEVVTEAVRTLLRCLPLDTQEPTRWNDRRVATALRALAALHPRDEIELMLATQALAAYHAAAANWHLGMNHHTPNGDSSRHFSVAASAARTFDTLLKAVERRQARPLLPPADVSLGHDWSNRPAPPSIRDFELRVTGELPDPGPAAVPTWTAEAIGIVGQLADADRHRRETEGLDIENTKGILPGGGMIVPENPDEKQQAYLGRRIGLKLREQHLENQRKGIKGYPKIPHIRPGDFVP